MVERWILARIRNETFFSLTELNRRLRGLIEDLNGRAFQKLPGTRRSAFEEIDRPALKPLPAQPYQFAEWKKATVSIDYHVELEGHYYSVPYRLLRKKLDLRYTESTIECFYQNTRVASHIRSYLPGRHTTLKEHMPAVISAGWSGPRSALSAGARRSDRPVLPSSRPSSAPGRIPSRASARL